jgi:hypothetical protein
MANGDRSPTRRIGLYVVGLAVAGFAIVILTFYAHERWSLQAGQFAITYGTGPIDPFRKFEVPGIVRPPTVEAARSKLREDETVVGFVVAGRARAYRLEAFNNRSRHVVNDVVGETPVSVTFCDLDHCVRGYKGQAGGKPLDVSTAGLFQGHEMILEINGQRYFQNSGREFEPSASPSKLPLESIDPTLTTWGAWKRDHPETDVYEGLH